MKNKDRPEVIQATIYDPLFADGSKERTTLLEQWLHAEYTEPQKPEVREE